MLPRFRLPAAAVRPAVRLLAGILPFLLFPTILSAQMEGGIPPQVTITPMESSFTGPTPTISIRFWDEGGLNTSTRVIKHNVTTVTSSFTHAPVTSSGMFVSTTSSATITLAPGTNTIYAWICDEQADTVPLVNRCTDATATYTYVAGQPAVRVSPDGGEVTAAAGTSSAHVFRVVNPGTRSGTYQLRTHCRDAWTGLTAVNCTLSTSSVMVAAGDSVNVTVTLPGSAAGSTRVVWLSAEVSGMPGVADAGWKDVVMTSAGGSTPQAPYRRWI